MTARRGRPQKYSNELMIDCMKQAHTHYGYSFSGDEFDAMGFEVKAQTVIARFGSWNRAKTAADVPASKRGRRPKDMSATPVATPVVTESPTATVVDENLATVTVLHPTEDAEPLAALDDIEQEMLTEVKEAVAVKPIKLAIKPGQSVLDAWMERQNSPRRLSYREAAAWRAAIFAATA